MSKVARLGTAALLTATAGTATACSTPSATTPLARTVSSLKPLRSGQLDLKLTWSAGSAATAGFAVAGPFADPRPGQVLPTFSLTASRIGSNAPSTTVASDGTQAVARSGSTSRPLTPAEVAGLKGKSGADLTGLRSLGVSSWATGAQSSSTDPATGDVTVSAGADPVNAINSIVGLANASGAASGSLRPIPADQSAAVRNALVSSRLEVATGRTDHLLHRLHLVLSFAESSRSVLRSAAGPSANVSMVFDVTIAQPNQPVTVTLPGGG